MNPMNDPLDEDLLNQFKGVLDAPAAPGRQKEQIIQDFMEEHTVLIPTPNLLNHHLHFQAIISKFPLGTELTTDYVYITKSSDRWVVTFVELESPDKPLFNKETKNAIPSAELNAAIGQVRSWKIFLRENRREVLRRLAPIMQPINMRINPTEFAFQLIIGRSSNKNLTLNRKRLWANLIVETEIDLFTFDQVIERYQNLERFPKHVLRLTGEQYAFKHMESEPSSMLCYMGPEQLALGPQEIERLKGLGYEMEKWGQGDLLTYGKLAGSTREEHMKDGRFFLKKAQTD